ncbi:MAG: cation:proton antiporter [Clostridia bacterium]
MLSTWLPLTGNALVLLSMAVVWLSGFFMTRLTKLLHLPNVTGYILAGVVIGPYLLRLIPSEIVSGMDFMTDAALSFIAFGVGRYLRMDALKKSGPGIITLTIAEALVAAALVTLTMYYVFHLSLAFSLLLGAIGSATAPASSLMTIRQYHAKGAFVDTLVQVVALDDAVALIAFSLCAAVAEASTHAGAIDAGVVLMPVALNILALALGVGLGFLLSVLINERRSKDHRLVLACAFIFALAALCAAVDISPMLSVMAMGTVYANAHQDKSLFKQLNRMTPPILLMFFVLSGMRLDIPMLTSAGVIGLAYFLVRIAGKFIGAYLGARLGGFEAPIRRYLGLALIPQAGVSIGLAALAHRILPGDGGVLISTIILSSSVLYEMIGPLSAKVGLILSGAIGSAGDVPGLKFLERFRTRERLGKYDDIVYVAGQQPTLTHHYANSTSKRAPTSIADAYLDSLNEVDKAPDEPVKPYKYRTGGKDIPQ